MVEYFLHDERTVHTKNDLFTLRKFSNNYSKSTLLSPFSNTYQYRIRWWRFQPAKITMSPLLHLLTMSFPTLSEASRPIKRTQVSTRFCSGRSSTGNANIIKVAVKRLSIVEQRDHHPTLSPKRSKKLRPLLLSQKQQQHLLIFSAHSRAL